MRYFLIIDCGTTNMRIHLLDEAEQEIDCFHSGEGVRISLQSAGKNGLHQALHKGISELLGRNSLKAEEISRCVAYGMITSDLGLVEIPHTVIPADSQSLKDSIREASFLDIAPFPILFIPGVKNSAEPATMQNLLDMDTMRGEETEAIGLYNLLGLTGHALLVLTGSHNKIIAMAPGGVICGSATSISGELLDAVTHHTILADATGSGFADDAYYSSEEVLCGAKGTFHYGIGRAAFCGRLLRILAGKPPETVRNFLLGAVMALDVEAMLSFAPNPQNVILTGRHSIMHALSDILSDKGIPSRMIPDSIAEKMGTHGAMIVVGEAEK